MVLQNALQSLGVGRGRVAVRGYGESCLVAANDSAQVWRMNRRVEIVRSDETGRTMTSYLKRRRSTAASISMPKTE